MGRSELFRHRGTATRGLEGLFGAGAGMAEFQGRELRGNVNAERIETREVQFHRSKCCGALLTTYSMMTNFSARAVFCCMYSGPLSVEY